MIKKVVSLSKITIIYSENKTLIEKLGIQPDALTLTQKVDLTPTKIKTSISKANQKKLPAETQALLNVKDIDKAEKIQEGDKGILPNSDLTVINGVGYAYFQEAKQVLDASLKIEGIKYGTTRPAGTEATAKMLTAGQVSKIKLDFWKNRKKVSVQMSPMKLIALAKYRHLGLIFNRNNEQVTLCLSGHWTTADKTEGDHAYPGKYIESRFFHVQSKTYLTSHKDSQIKEVFPDIFRTSTGKVNKIALMMHYLDASNLVGLCSDCNGSKNDNYLSWIVNNPYLGVSFMQQEFPLNYGSIVPRTKSGQGLGDAMIYFFMNKHEANQALNLSNQLSEDEQLLSDGKTTLGLYKQSKHIVLEQSKTLSKEDQKELDRLLALMDKKLKIT